MVARQPPHPHSIQGPHSPHLGRHQGRASALLHRCPTRRRVRRPHPRPEQGHRCQPLRVALARTLRRSPKRDTRAYPRGGRRPPAPAGPRSDDRVTARVRRWWRAICGPWPHVSVRIAPSGRPWMRRVSASQTWSALRPRGRATCDQVTGGALDQGRARTGPILFR